MFFNESRQVDARGGIFQDIGGNHIIIYAPDMINVINPGEISTTDSDPLGRLIAVAINSESNRRDPDSPSHSHGISPPEPSSTISSAPPTLPEINTISPESIRGATTLSYEALTDSPISLTPSLSASIRSGTPSLPWAEPIVRQVSQFSNEDDSIQLATLESFVDKLIADLSRGRLRF
jgi:hypothetical protein